MARSTRSKRRESRARLQGVHAPPPKKVRLHVSDEGLKVLAVGADVSANDASAVLFAYRIYIFIVD